MQKSSKAHILLVLCTLVWGSTFVVVKEALNNASPLMFNAVRLSLAAILLFAVLHRKLWPMSLSTLRAGVFLGFWMMLGYEFQTAGLALTTPSKSAFLTGLSVVLVPLLLAVFWRKRINQWTLLGVATALAGLYWLTLAGHGGLAGITRGDCLSLANSLAWSFQIIFLTRAARRHPFLQIVAVEVASAALMMWLVLPFAEPHGYLRWTPAMVAVMAMMVVLATVVVFIIQTWAQQFTPPAHASLIYSLEPVWAAVTSYVFLNERLGANGLLGGGLILAGILLSELLGSVQNPEAELAKEVD